MANETDAVADFLNEVTEPRDIFKEEPTLAEVEDVEEKPIRFDKDPKVQKYIEKQVQKALDKIPSAEQNFKKDVEDINLPDSFVALVGNDTPEKQKVLKDLSSYFGTLKGEARQEFLAEMKQQEEAKIQADAKAQEDLSNYLDEIEENYGVDLTSNTSSAKQLRAQFIDHVRKVAPKDENGEVAMFPDMLGAFEDFQEKNKRSPATRAKELASRGMTRSNDTAVGMPQGRSWKDVDRYLDSLKSNNN